ncbi:unnamed protein product [Periconia digitata]|uniref:glucan endo-1,3-beta-D-glucosidase n=1 Tax=Periconia digitata TaxID=1303443 RepID=A0A9W4XEB0_9PLEO|nr:unnamed protein product [Periconia digitata]
MLHPFCLYSDPPCLTIMIYFFTSFLLTIPLHVFGKSAAKLCHGSATLADDGNWYCSQVNAITYKNINQAGRYNRTTGIDPDSGVCHHEPIAYSGIGATTPLIGELSMHLRGPMNVSQIAVYKLPDVSANGGRQPRKRSDYKIFLEKELQESQSRGCSRSTITTTLYVTGSTCGQTVSSSTTCDTTSSFLPWSSPVPDVAIPPIPVVPPHIIPPLPPTIPSPPVITTAVHDATTVCSKNISLSYTTPLNGSVVNASSVDSGMSFPHLSTMTSSPNESFGMPASCETDTKSEAMHTMARSNERRAFHNTDPIATTHSPPLRAGDTWSRVAYYTSAAPAEATGFAFLANLGDPQKSGTFDYSFGNSLGYVIGDGSKVTTDNTPFDGTLATSEREIAVFTDEICDGNCEYARPDSVAHYGWGGPSKAFLIEFQMDHYDNEGSDQGMLSDAPAWWFLNAAIPRILQYGNDRNNIPCSCWSTGCGEFDAFELLGRGELRAKSTIHRQGNREGGDSNYFLRPVGRMLKFAVIFHEWNITARVLDDSFDFSQSLTQAQIDDFVAYSEDDDGHSLFPIGD